MNGKNYLNVTATPSTYANGGITHDYGAGNLQNWVSADFICVPFAGINSGKVISLKIDAPDSNNRLSYTFTDSWVGEKVLVIPIRTLVTDAGSPNLATVRYIIFSWTSASNASGTWRIGRVIRDSGVWGYVEVGVPDKLYAGIQNIVLTAYIQSLGRYSTSPFLGFNAITNNPAYTLASQNLYGLDGTTYYAMYGTNQKVEAFYLGKRGESPLKIVGTTIPSIQYSKAKTRCRVAVAVKMPSADLAASASSGGGQVKFKLEVYVV